VKKCGDILRIDSEMEVMPKGVKKAITIYEIGGIADEFNLFLPPKKAPSFSELKSALKIVFVVVEGKHAADTSYHAEMTKLSLKGAELKSAFIVDKLNNIKITLFTSDNQEVCDDLYAKVSHTETDGFIISFTAIPPEAENFFNSILVTEQ
jgi:adenylate cyclase